MRLKFYDSAEAILCRYWGATAEELKEGFIEAEVLESGEATSMTFEDQVASVEKMGVWGFVTTQTKAPTIHMWADKDTPDEMLMHFLGHEIGHIKGRQYKTQRLEELKAEDFGHTAREAYQLFKRVKNRLDP